METVEDRFVNGLSDAGPRAAWGAFVLAFAAMFLYALDNQQLAFRGDAYETWEVAKSLVDPASTFRSYVEYRGFVVFVLNAMIYRLSVLFGIDGVLTFRFFASLVFAGLSAVSLPVVLGRLAGVPPTFARRAFCVAVAFLFFRGHFLYPSNDWVAWFFLLLSLNTATGSAPPKVGRAAAIGLWMGAAVLSRSNYIVSVPFVVWLVLRSVGFGHRKRAAVCGVALVLVLGAMFALNAGYSAHREQVAGKMQTDARRVLNGQLTNGLRMQRIEWNAGDDSYPGMLVLEEGRGKAILAADKRETGWLHWYEYLGMVPEHAADFAVLYARHLFNGLDLAYPTVYVQDLRQRSLLFSVLNFALIFLSLAALSRSRPYWPRQAPALLAIALPALSCVPFPVEPRFFMSLAMFLHALPAFTGPWHRNATVKYWLMLVAAVATCIAISAQIFQSLEGAPLPFHTLP